MPSIYAGTNKIKKMYIGTTQIKKVYAGATLVWASQLTYGTATNLSQVRQRPASASIGDYVLFGGGQPTTSSKSSSSVVDTYNTSLVKGIATPLTDSARDLGGASNSSYAIFAGGAYYDETSQDTAAANAYNSSLVKSIPALLSNTGRVDTWCSTPLRAMFAMEDKLDYYNTNLAKGTVTFGSYYFYEGSVATTSGSGVYAIFADASSTSVYSHAYNISSMVRTTITDLPISARMATPIGTYALFTDGNGTIYAYNDSLVLSTPITTAIVRGTAATCATLGDAAIFAGGNSTITETVDKNLILSPSTVSPLSIARNYIASGVVGNNYVLFAGGQTGAGVVATVEYYGY